MIARLWYGPEPTANERFKLGYERTLRWSALVALALTILLFLMTPRYEAHPYRMPLLPPIEWVEPEPLLPVPPQPRRLTPPKPIEPVEDDQLAEEIPLPETLVRFDDLPGIGIAREPGWSEPVFEASATPPVLLERAAPDYPEMARLGRLEGEVTVHVLVGPGGSVLEALVARGAHPLLDRAALAAARRCVFRPGRQRDHAVPVWVAVPYRFRLR
jgi:protein TonB